MSTNRRMSGFTMKDRKKIQSLAFRELLAVKPDSLLIIMVD